MDLQKEILREHSKRQCLRIATWIGNDEERFKSLMTLFLKGEYRTTQRAAWIVKHCADRNPYLILPYLGPMIDRMLEPDVHVAVKRNVVRILQELELPRKYAGKVATICFNFLESPKEPIAVRVFAMTVLANLAQAEPGLRNEIRILVERQLEGASAGFRSRARKVLKQVGAESTDGE
ncbi:MAG TPA: hypothetical protein VMG34_13775 [Bacteroidota bacterium]|nr:hypothetical protein [Bacteroidota bacterium]